MLLIGYKEMGLKIKNELIIKLMIQKRREER